MDLRRADRSPDHKGPPDKAPVKDIDIAKAPWVETTGGSGMAGAVSTAIGPDGTLCMAGFFKGPLTLGSVTTTTTDGAKDLFVACYTRDGALKWVYVASAPDEDRSQEVSVDAQGYVWIVGDLETSLNFPRNGSLGPLTLKSEGDKDLFVARLTPAGDLQWAVRGGGPGKDMALALVTTQTTAYVGGFMGAGATLAGSTGQLGPLPGGNLTQAFVAKFDAAGKASWLRTCGGTSYEELRDLTLDAKGNLYAVGIFNSPTFSCQSQTTPAISRMGTADAFLARFKLAVSPPTVDLVTTLGGSGAVATWTSVALGPLGEIYTAGYYHGSLAIAGTTLPLTTMDQALVVRLDAAGKGLWAITGTGQQGSAIWSILGDSQDLLVAGHYEGAFILGNYAKVAGGGSDDIFIARLNPQKRSVSKLIPVPGSGWDRAWSIASGPGGLVAAAGEFSSQVSFNGIQKTAISTGAFLWGLPGL